MGKVVLNNALKATLLSLQHTSKSIDNVMLRLANGLKVSSALDNPQNFFASVSLSNQAADLNRLLDGISQSIRAIELAASGLEAITKFIDQAEELAIRRQADIEAIDTPAQIDEQSYLSHLITEQGADFYFRLDDAGAAADNSGDSGTGATYSAGVSTQAEALFEGSNGSAYFNGVNAYVNTAYTPLISGNFTEKTIEFVFNADTVSGRQMIYSQGNAARGIDIYTDGDQLYLTATNTPAFGNGAAVPQPIFRTTIEAGKTYHTALVFSRDENRLEAFLNGESLGSSQVGNGTFFGHAQPVLGRQNAIPKSLHDGASTSLNYFKGYISDLAIHNEVLTDDQILEHALAIGFNDYSGNSTEYTNIIEQIQRTAIDSNYRGFDLLRGKAMTTQFSPSGQSFLTVDGIDIVSYAGGLPSERFDDTDDLSVIIDRLRSFKKIVRSFAGSISADLNIIKTRKTFTQDQISTLSAGRDDLTLADQNKDGASLLALQTRQQLGITALSLAAQSTQQTLRLF